MGIIKSETYVGLDRRKGPRRLNAERRAEIRFELDKTPRRGTKDRRKAGSWDGLYTV